MFLYNSPSKFTEGTSSLWKGGDLAYIKFFFLNYFKLKDKTDSNILMYESARSAILHSLKCLKVSSKDQVIASSFTCDAVTKAVVNSGAKIVYVDINQDFLTHHIEF